jgi:hypothetical protein
VLVPEFIEAPAMASSWLAAVLALLGAASPPDATPEDRAVDYLCREVPRWSAENRCFSCHNNGDGARALFAAARLGRAVPDRALADTTRWLSRPERWDDGGDQPSGGKGLARIQFAAAASDAFDAGLLKDRTLPTRAADLVAERQQQDGSWRVDAAGTTGSPVTYGTCLATALARRTLVRADPRRFQAAIARADRWLRRERVAGVLDAAGVLLGLAGADDPEARAQRRHCLALIRKGQDEAGGWGPHVSSAPEPFDTAVVLLALIPFKDQEECKSLLRRGRGFLLSRQRADGSWPETTRPAGGESYAQRLSTSAWATLALLATAR